MKTSNKVLKAAAIASLLAGGAVAGSFINAESAQAGPQSSKVSGALTSVLSNGVTNSFAAEVVLPQESITSTGAVTMNVTYATVSPAVGTSGGTADNTQIAITTAVFNADTATYAAQTVEAATSRAIGTAAGSGQYGSVSDIVKSFQSGGLD
ncbi:TEK-like protein [Anabaena sp. AL93]|uniref:TEK-like protein n=1 Tax=Anabaena sp. AL93 TaxID=1678133 RepID=UPI0007FE7B58|nr:TEK-like protein [Anabaena sp. AL93]OBQ15398.1 MAG: hypothetical protein AN486_23525 [Anabaena sp. AL93]